MNESRRACWRLFVVAFLAGSTQAPEVRAHDARPAYLEINQHAAQRYEILWRTPLMSGMRLPVVLKLPDGVHTQGEPLERELRDSVVERRLVEAPQGLAGKRFEFVGLETTITDVLVRVRSRDGPHSTVLVHRSQPWFEIQAPRGRLATASVYLRHGVAHILLGYDHLILVLALCLIVPNRRSLIATISAFTIAHSITLASSTLGVLRMPSAPVEASIALSLLLIASEILAPREAQKRRTQRWPWAVAFCFGLLHGFGFAGALADIGLPPAGVPLALLAFNAGVELGQLGVIALFLASLRLFRRLALPSRARAYARPAIAYPMGATASFWFFQRLTGFLP